MPPRLLSNRNITKKIWLIARFYYYFRRCFLFGGLLVCQRIDTDPDEVRPSPGDWPIFREP